MTTTANGTNGTTGEKKAYVPPPEGVYRARGKEAAFAERQTKNGPQKRFEVLVTLLDGKEHAGKSVKFSASFDSPKARAFLKKALMLLGWDGVVPLSQWQPNPAKEVSVTIGHYQLPAMPAREAASGQPARPAREARTEAEVKYINSLDGSGGMTLARNAMAPEKSKAVGDALMAMFAEDGDAGVGATSPEPTTFGGDAAPGKDDEIPF